jgi:hypothetical protein
MLHATPTRAVAPLDLELAAAETAAVDAALAALRARPPAECARCGMRGAFAAIPNVPAWWRCEHCSGGTFRALPTPAEEHEVTTRARAEARVGVVAPLLEAAHRRIAVEERRDRRPLAPLHAAWRALLLHRAAPARYPVTRSQHEWQDHRLIDLAQKHLEVTGHDDPFVLRAVQLAPVVLFGGGGAEGWVRSAHGFLTTSDFAGLLDGVAGTVFLDAYGDTVKSFEAWTTAIEVADFKSTIAAVLDFPDLLEVAEHGEYVAGSPFGPAAPVRLTRFGRVVPFTREAVLRDDMPSFGQLAQALGVAAAQAESDATYDLLVSNPKMPDGQPLFSAAHGNLMAGHVLDATSLGAACATLATISNHGRPAFVVCGTSDGAVARELVTKQTPPGAGDASGVLEVIVDDRVTGGFYVTCDPAERPTLVTAHLRGVEPELLARDGWDVDARLYKGRNEFGVAAVGPRSMVFTPAT